MKNREALERSNNKVHDEFTQSRFRGVVYRRGILDNSRKGDGEVRARILFLISPLPHSYQPTIVSWADITVSPFVQRWSG